ncbi:MAG: A/G-specific adenine glycosylase [Verrucomicrobiales bacterium]|nr:A/G-specific adenine glycosylase [Verrucomicrobiales bacterium]
MARSEILKGSDEGEIFERVFAGHSSINSFQASLINWFELEGESYPWRETTDPYPILVSELMLQQTQISTVLGKGYFRRWLEQFPTWEALAEAEELDLLKAWEGLGYYNRARNLQKTARVILNEYNGTFPREHDQILALPGVGPYTAGAVLSFAFNQRAPIVDGNVTRVLARLFGINEAVDSSAVIRFFWKSAEAMTPDSKVREYNSAIMELGQRVCIRSSPKCGECPVNGHCVALREGTVDTIPMKKKRAKTVLREEFVGIGVKNGRIFLTTEEGSRRLGLWRLPELTADQADDLAELFRFDYAITKYKVCLRCFVLSPALIGDLDAPGQGDWYSLQALDSLPPMGSPYLKVIRKYQNLHDELNLSS